MFREAPTLLPSQAGAQSSLALVMGIHACDCPLHLFPQGQGGRELTLSNCRKAPIPRNSWLQVKTHQKRFSGLREEKGVMPLSLGPAVTMVPSVQVGPSDTGTQSPSSISRQGLPWACSLPSSPATPSTSTLMCYCWHHPLSCRIKEIAAFPWSYSRFS